MSPAVTLFLQVPTTPQTRALQEEKITAHPVPGPAAELHCGVVSLQVACRAAVNSWLNRCKYTQCTVELPGAALGLCPEEQLLHRGGAGEREESCSIWFSARGTHQALETSKPGAPSTGGPATPCFLAVCLNARHFYRVL